jgi:glycosyltransferase involved in cell wall biosynthesis
MTRTGTKHKILYITPYWPRHDESAAGFVRGGSQNRSLSVLQALREMGEVDVIILDDEKAQGELVGKSSYGVNIARSLEIVAKPNKNLLEKVRWTLDANSSYPNGCGVDSDAMRRVREDIQNYDLVWFFKLRAPDVFPNTSWARSVLDIDDVPSTCERAKLTAGIGFRERLLALRGLASWSRREKMLGHRFNVLTVCSEEDKTYLRKLGLTGPIHVIPNTFAEPHSKPQRIPAHPPRIGFIGLMEHFPNRDGVHWFAKECWPRIKQKLPEARLRLVGVGTDGPLRPAGPDIDGLGWIENPSDEIRTWATMVVPIRIGGGTRVKIAQGFAEYCPLVSTHFGATGYQARHGYEMCLADSAEDFADACIQLICDPQSAEQMAERAWAQFLEKWSWNSIRPRVWAAAEDCLRLSAGTPRSA